MGRARVTLKQISSERCRKTTLARRKRGLMKKMWEFSKRCGGEQCLIVYDDDGDVEAVTSPQNPIEIHSMIQKYYETQLKNGRPHKTYGIQEFFENRKNMIEAEISKVHKEISSIKYPTWDPSFVNMEEDELRAFCAHVDAKIQACDEGIKLLKNKNVPNLMQNFDENSYLLRNMEEGGFSFVPNMPQENISQSQPLLQDFMELYDKNYEAVDVPLNSTNQLSELEFEELIWELSNCDSSYQPCHLPHQSLLPTISAQYQNQTNYYSMLSFTELGFVLLLYHMSSFFNTKLVFGIFLVHAALFR
ncbi:agamous-like MADS-box protein AGL8 homolog [Vigna unguiculata]|uniref:agamous-like MADS-box protein AGL8 homolog n=1 Tax=Vigna unguiculata TaxID=3917 RepID=UPI001015FB05|nr:agamous-like MADS-box protein AGL8 homolog [Vigna unguiculata]